MFTSFKTCPLQQILPGFRARFIHTQFQTHALVEVDEAAILPEHSHHNEQISQVLEGVFEMTVQGETKTCRPGDVVVIPPNVPHSGKAITSCRILDVFTPGREDYIDLPVVES